LIAVLRALFGAMLIGLSWPAAAQSSMSADEAYVRAVTYMQSEFSKLRADAEITRIQLAAATAELQRLRALARKADRKAQAAMQAFAAGEGDRGVDALLRDARAQPGADAETFQRIGALAIAVDPARAIEAWENAHRLAPRDGETMQSLSWLYQSAGRLDEAEDIARQLIAAPDPRGQTFGFMRLGGVAQIRGDLDAAKSSFGRALQIAEAHRLPDREAAALTNLGLIAQTRGDLNGAGRLFERALAIATARDNKAGMADALGNLGVTATIRGDLAAAEAFQDRALAVNTEIARKTSMADALANLGVIARTRGDLDRAADFQRRALALHTEMGSKDGMASARIGLGMIALARKDYAGAETELNRALGLATELGDQEAMANAMSALGVAQFEAGKRSAACGRWRAAAALYQGLGARGADTARVTADNLARLCPRG
jgi:tetratricopeptide (TPR) repeat protein